MMQTSKLLIAMDRHHSIWLQDMATEMWWQFCWQLVPHLITLTVMVGLHSEQLHGEGTHRSESSQVLYAVYMYFKQILTKIFDEVSVALQALTNLGRLSLVKYSDSLKYLIMRNFITYSIVRVGGCDAPGT
jgi:hypothetical protein